MEKFAAIVTTKNKDAAAVRIKFLEQWLQLQKYCFYWTENDNFLPSRKPLKKG